MKTLSIYGLVLLFGPFSFAQQGRDPNLTTALDQLRATRPAIDFNLAVAPNEVKIMAYNVENLFDTEPDAGKEDFTFIPVGHPAKAKCKQIKVPMYRKECEETDWTPAKLDIKLDQIKRVVDAQGSLPDLMAVEEIENDNVAGMLAKKLGYSKHIVTEGPDDRGIDVGLLFNEEKLTYVNHESVTIPVTDGKPTRDILVVRFKLPLKGTGKNEVLSVFVNHWPSQSAPAQKRVDAAEVLKAAIVSEQKRFAGTGVHIVAMGDFNTLDSDNPNPFHRVLLNSDWDQNLSDVHELYVDKYSSHDPDKMKTKIPVGTYFYLNDFSWNRLDRFFISKSLLDGSGPELVGTSYRIVAPEFATKKAIDDFNPNRHTFGSVVFGAPWAYWHNAYTVSHAGFSDHFPIVMKLKY